MKKLTYIIVLAVALVAGQALAVQVKQVALSYENGATVARVTADGPFQFRHQTEVPKEGKGDRMILDLIGVTTALSAKNYSNLPLCGITGIRTGQYSVTPEKVVRVVFDLTKPPVYQVQQQGNSIKVIFTDKAVTAFTTWTTDAVAVPTQPTVVSKPATSVAQAPVTVTPKPVTLSDKAATTEQDRLASLSSNAEPVTLQQTVPTTSSPTTAPNKPVVVEAKPLATAVPVNPPTAETTKPTAQPAVVATPTPTVVAQPIQSEPKPVPTPTVAVKPVQESPKPVATPTTVADANNKPTTQAAAPVTPLAKPVPVTTSANQIQQALSARPNNVPATDAKPTVTAKADDKVEVKPVAVVPTTPAQTAPQVKVPIKTDTTPSTEVARVNVATPVTMTPSPVKPNDSNAKPATASIPKPLTDDGNGELVEATDAETESANPDLPSNKSTARFRRNAAADAKIKGTMVAEFPQRLVVKYESLGNRDPFATLIDDSRTYNTPIQNRVPNIDGLRLVGIIESDRGASDNRALFEDKNGYSYILSSGDKVQRGYVLRVENDRVYFQIFEYGWSRTVALAIENAN